MKTRAVSISFPKDLLEKIDRERGLIDRSKFVCAVLRLYFEERETESSKEARVTRRVEVPVLRRIPY